MSLLDLNSADTIAAAPRYVEPPRAAPRFSAWSAIPRGIGEAGLQVGATAADLWNSFKAVRDASPEQRKLIDRQGAPVESMSSATGDELRTTGRGLRVDPIDASVAESVLYEFARAGSKVVAGAVLGGPLGVVAAGVEEGITQADDLRRKGVGLDARQAAGLVQGAGLALAALPAAGQTLRATLALYAAGGPGGYMAQQALTREILQRAGHDKLAGQFDPFDPVGLAVSALVPAPFAALGLRNARRAAAAKAADEFRAGPVPSERTPVAQAAAEAMPRDVVDAAMVVRLQDAAQRINEPPPVHLREAGAPVQSLADFVAAGKYEPPPAPKAPGPDGFLAWIKANGGIDIGEKLDITGEANGVRLNPAGIFRRGGITTDDLASRAAAEGYLLPDQAGDTRAMVELVKRAVAGDRVLTVEQQMEKAARDYAQAQESVRLADLEDRMRLLGEDPAAARGNAQALADYLAQHEGRLFGAAMDELQSARSAVDGGPEFDALRDRARLIAQDMEDGGRSTVEQYEAEVAPLSPVMRRLVQEVLNDAATTAQAPKPEAAAPARGAGGPPAAAGAADAGRPAAGVEAAGVAPRADIDGQPVATTAADQAEGAAVRARLEAVRAEHPDLQVMLDGMDRPMRLDDFLAAVKAEADEMAADAPLMELAAQCAIVNGR